MRVDTVVVWGDDQTMIAVVEPEPHLAGEAPTSWSWRCVVCDERPRAAVQTANAAMNGLSVHLVTCPVLRPDGEVD